MKLLRKVSRPISLILVFAILGQILVPLRSYAITGSDSMPEYSSFEPVATSNMVNMFSGDFTYNIPLLNVPNGYPINLTYHSSNINNEAMSSWVGLGWNINPGTINRSKRGFPDEFKGESMRYHNRMPANWTVAAAVNLQAELLGDEDLANLSLGGSIRYNNYSGIGTSLNTGFNFAGVVNLDFSHSQGKFGFNASVNPWELLSVNSKIKARKQRRSDEAAAKKAKEENKEEKQESSEDKVHSVSKVLGIKPSQPENFFSIRGSQFGSMSTSGFIPYPVSLNKYSGIMVSIQADVGVNPISLPIDGEVSLSGSFTRQKNEEIMDVPVYGYLNSEWAIADENSMMDYSTEMSKPFEKREKYMAYPLPNNDVFIMTGEAMGGSFRAFRSEYGNYRKNYLKSKDLSVDVGADVNLASIVTPAPPIYAANLLYSAGASVGASYHWTSIGAWDDSDLGKGSSNLAGEFKFRSQSEYQNSDEKFYYKFNGDKAGYFDLSNNDNAVQGILNKSLVNATVDNSNFLNSGSQSVDYRHSGKHKKRSTFISTHLNEDFDDLAGTSQYKVYERNAKVWNGTSAIPYDHTQNPAKGIGEIVTYNNDGVTYVYGLPVHVRNERELQYSMESVSFLSGNEGLIATVSSTNTIDVDAKRKLGYEPSASGSNTNHQYATTFLLTQILGPDYVDRTGDGPTPDDFGSYTKFNYEKIAGGSDWYPFRTPYEGLSFNAGSLSSSQDDMGSFSYGEKEIYFLHSVVSKTHVAIFKLSSDREDGRAARVGASPSMAQLISGTGISLSDTKKLKKLERIDLFPLNECTNVGGSFYTPIANAIPVKSVRFDYSYDLSPNVPNSSTGKLTLEKVWFEYGGVVPQYITPYQFHYSYPQAYPSPYNQSANPGDISHYSSIPGSVQNPSYIPSNTDRWGNYRNYQGLVNSIGSLARFWPYVNQNDDVSYDPAAYCLKRIQLPSGGEIHVQYEQHDYAFVQDKRAMVMVPLKGGSPGTSTDETNSGVNQKKYYLDLEKIGISSAVLGSLASTDKTRLADDLFEPMLKEQKRLFFNFLYALIGDNVNYQQNHTDFIEGYARIEGYGWDVDGFFFTFKGTPSGYNYYKKINYTGNVSKRELPRMVCRDFYKSQRRGKVDGGQNVLALENKGESGTGEEIANAFVSLLTTLTSGFETKCKKFDPAMSYVRVQAPSGNYRGSPLSAKAYVKLGGGVRVKRLLMYDSGKVGPEVVYGNEYNYRTYDDKKNCIISSGVATNEPGNGRRENTLVNPIDREQKSKLEAILFGRDMYSQEGPIGESLLPSPSIGYSEVEVMSIHSGKTGTGKEVHKFYTVKDRPFFFDPTPIDMAYKHPATIAVKLGPISIQYTRKTPHQTQGYVFKEYNMHGQVKSIEKFAQGNNTPLFTQVYDYYSEGDKVNLMGDGMLVTNSIDFEQLGKESEILSESNQVTDYALGGSIKGDVSTGTATFVVPVVPAPIIIPAGMTTKIKGGGSLNENIHRTYVTSKIISYPAIVKSIKTRQDGNTKTSSNLILDDNTGDPVLVKSTDDFSTGVYYNQTFKGSWKYNNMRSKFLNEQLLVTPSLVTGSSMVFGTNGSLDWVQFNGDWGCDGLANFTRGDLIEIDQSSTPFLYHVDKVDLGSKRLYLQRSQFTTAGFTNGSTVSSLKIHRSGYTNQLNEVIGNVVYFKWDGNPVFHQGSSSLSQNTDFLNALNNWLNTLTGVSGTSSTVLSGPYTMDITTYQNQIPFGCNVNLSSATITNVDVSTLWSNGVMELQIKGFVLPGCNATIDCN